MSVFPPDSFIVAEVAPSPNFDERKDGRPPDMILLHYTGMQTGEAALQRLTRPDSKVSAHYVVFEDGRIVQCVPEEARAWHAGESSGPGETDINSRSIGIEIVNPGHEFGYPRFPAAPDCRGDFAVQCRSSRGADDQRRPRARAFRRRASRKQDPGEKFPWGLLSESGVGHWVRRRRSTSKAPASSPATAAMQVTRLQRTLRAYGYGIEETATMTMQTREVVTAFQRHFRQARVDGVADPSTLLTLRALMETRPARVRLTRNV